MLKENRNMIDSFAVISTELSTLALNLKALEEERLKQAQVGQAIPFFDEAGNKLPCSEKRREWH